MQADKELFRMIVIALALEVIGITPQIELIMDLIGSDYVNSVKFRKNPAIREIVDVSSGKFRVKSSILAKFILMSLEESTLTVETLIEALKGAEARERFNHTHREIFRKLIDHSNVQNVLPERNRRANTIKYYESIKNLRGTAKNPYFWLQYAIARMALKEYKEAEFYFETAYGYAEGTPWFQTYQIDNHYARLLLEKPVHDNEPENCMDHFRRAHAILVKQTQEKRRHYAYRVAANYNPFYFHFQSRLGSKDHDYIMSCCREILNSIIQLPMERKRDRYILDCKNRLEEVLASGV